MQFQADMLGAEVVRPLNAEATAMGAAYMTGLGCGFWDSPEACLAGQQVERVFTPQMDAAEREQAVCRMDQSSQALHGLGGAINQIYTPAQECTLSPIHGALSSSSHGKPDGCARDTHYRSG